MNKKILASSLFIGLSLFASNNIEKNTQIENPEFMLMKKHNEKTHYKWMKENNYFKPYIEITNSITTNEDEDIMFPYSIINNTKIKGTKLEYFSNNGELDIGKNDIIYIPKENFYGEDTVELFLKDGNKTIAQNIININVLPINDLPNLANFELITPEDTKLIKTLKIGDAENDDFVVSAVALNGDVNISNNNTLEYMPNKDFFGEDYLEITIKEPLKNSKKIIKKFINVTQVNDKPIINKQPEFFNKIGVKENTITKKELLRNVIDVDNKKLKIKNFKITSKNDIYSHNNSWTILQPNLEISYSISDGENVINNKTEFSNHFLLIGKFDLKIEADREKFIQKIIGFSSYDLLFVENDENKKELYIVNRSLKELQLIKDRFKKNNREMTIFYNLNY